MTQVSLDGFPSDDSKTDVASALLRRSQEFSQRSRSWAERYGLQLLGWDALAVLVVTSISFASMVLFDRISNSSTSAYAALSVIIAVAWLGLLAVMRTRDGRIVGAGYDEYRRVVATCTVYAATAIGALLVGQVIPRSYFLIALPLGIILLPVERSLNRRWLAARRRKGAYLTKVIVVGESTDVRYVVDQIARKTGSVEFDVVGAVLPVGSDLTAITARGTAVPIVGFTDAVPSIISRVGADAVIVAGQLNGGSAYVRQLGWELEATSTELVLAPGLTNIAGPRIHWRPVEGLPLMHVELPQYYGTKHVVKRAMDIVLSAAALIVLAPALVIIAILVRRDSEGPAFFKQTRVGREGRVFTMYKFRTMVLDAEARREELVHLNEAAGVLFKMADDPRITRIGKILRRYSLDELPQFWNVFLGDMSLVGPRPWIPSELMPEDLVVSRRLYSKPGITGLWQTNGRSDLDWDETIRLDLYYVENWSVTGDVVLLFRTAKQLLRPAGAY